MTKHVQPSQLAFNREDLIAAASVDYDTFAGLLIAEHMEYDIDDYQRRVFWRMVSDKNLRYACALPRGHIKTTLLKLAFVYILTYRSNSFPVYFAGTHPLAENAISDIVDILRSESYTATYGQVRFTVERGSRGDYEFVLNHWTHGPTGWTAQTKACILRGRSSGQSVRGMSKKMRRPDFMAFDDIDQDDDITEVGYDSLKAWVYGPVMKLGYKNTRVVHIGNYIARKCVIGDHIGDPYWVSDHFSALLPDGTPLWPSYWTREELLADYRAYEKQGRAQDWFAEMLNNPLENANGIIRMSDIKFIPEALPRSDSHTYFFLTVDPAISKSARANEIVVAVHAFHVQRQVWQCVELVYRRGYDPIDLYRLLISLSQKWGINVWGIEAIAYQASLLPLYQRFLRMHNLKIKVVATPGSKRAKSERIIAWLGLLKAGTYCLTEGMFTILQNILAYDASKEDQRDDDLDACAYFIPMFAAFANMIAAPSDDVQTVMVGDKMIPIDQFIPR